MDTERTMKEGTPVIYVPLFSRKNLPEKFTQATADEIEEKIKGGSTDFAIGWVEKKSKIKGFFCCRYLAYDNRFLFDKKWRLRTRLNCETTNAQDLIPWEHSQADMPYKEQIVNPMED